MSCTNSGVLLRGATVGYNPEGMVLTIIAMGVGETKNVGSRIGVMLIDLIAAEITFLQGRELALGPSYVVQFQMHLLYLCHLPP